MVEPAASHFDPDLLYTAASLYYLDDLNQKVIAERLNTSRATVSRMLAEARRIGMVRIDVRRPGLEHTTELAARTAEVLGLDRVWIAPTTSIGGMSAALAPLVGKALEAVGLQAGDVLLVSSGRTVYEVTQGRLPSLPGVEIAPMIGGQSEPQPWYQTNEIVRQFAGKVGGVPNFLHAPALPGPELHRTLTRDPSVAHVLEMWRSARCALVGIGPPPLTRASIPDFVPLDAPSLRDAVGDVCSRFYDRDGQPVPFPGLDRMISTPLETIRDIPVSIGVAIGDEKLLSILAGARAGYVTQLVTDARTAQLLVEMTADADAQQAV